MCSTRSLLLPCTARSFTPFGRADLQGPGAAINAVCDHTRPILLHMTRRTRETRREALRLLDPTRALVLDVREAHWEDTHRRGKARAKVRTR